MKGYPHRIRIHLAVIALLSCMVAQLHAASTVSVVVTSVSGRDVFLDRGRGAGIGPDMRVRFFPPGAAAVEGIVRDVSSNNARVEMLPGNSPPQVGTVGEVQVPDTSTAPATDNAATSSPTTIPAHAPWTRQEGARTADMPLLAPAFSKPPSERAPTYHGRVYTQFQLADDRGDGRDNQYYLGRVGTALTVTNPFHQGGELRLDTEFDRRGADLTDSGDGSEDDYILDQLSYAIGTEEYSPYRLEMGRFYSYYLPEIGTIDGVEGALRFQNGLSLGGAVGAYPVAFPDREEGDDYGFHVFADYHPDGVKAPQFTLGYQKTWHKGSADRDLLIARASVWPTPNLWLYASAQIDIYTNSDTLKSSGPHLTTGWFQARYTPDDVKGAAVSVSRYTYADVKRDEYEFVPPALIQDGQVDRVEVSVWHNLTKDLRPTLRGSYFSDQTDDGFGGELDLDWTNALHSPVNLYGAVYYNEGTYTKDMGFRTEARMARGNFDFFVGYEFDRYTQRGMIANIDYLTRQAVRGGVGYQFGKWYYTLSLDHYFGDSENSYVLGTYLEYRF
jgi:hypothetical protein